MASLRLAFMGTPDFAVPSLEALVAAGHNVACVYAQPPRPAGRGHQVQASPVQVCAERLGLPVRTPKSLRTPVERRYFAEMKLDVGVVAAYGLLLPLAILETPRFGCFNVHASLLPRWRGAAPIQHAILAGDAETGVTIMQMDEGLDTGAMALTGAVPIGSKTTASDLHDRLAEQGARLIVEAMDRLGKGTLATAPQPETGATYAPKLTREHGRLDWHRPAADLERRVRALTPWPGAWFEAQGERIKVLTAEVVEGVESAAPGTLLDGRLTFACGNRAVRLTRVQRPGRGPVDGEAFLRGFPLPVGTRLSAADEIEAPSQRNRL